MSKKYRSKKSREQAFVRLFYGMLALAAILVVVLIVATTMLSADNGGYSVTADGHVHDAAGNHIGDYEEMLANGQLVLTEDGHLHDAAGNHVSEIAVEAADDHDHEAEATGEEAAAEGEEAAAPAEGTAE